MALSEREQELLAQLEKQLSDDPSFAASMPSNLNQGTPAPVTIGGRNLVLGLLIAVVGLGVLLVGVSTKLILVGVLGFVIAAGGVYYCTVKPNKTAPATSRPVGTGKAAKNPSGFMRNLEDKWDERQNGAR